jgi:hypothetical protein
VAHLHEASADTLAARGDVEKAVSNYIAADTDAIKVLRRFPDLVPQPLHDVVFDPASPLLKIAATTSAAARAFGHDEYVDSSSSPGSNRYADPRADPNRAPLAGGALAKAAAAIVQLCLHHRPKLLRRAFRAEKVSTSVLCRRYFDGNDLTARNLRHRCAITSQSQRSFYNRLAFAQQTLHHRCAIAAQSLCDRRAIAAQSFRNYHENHFAIAAQSIATAMQSLRDLCAIAA